MRRRMSAGRFAAEFPEGTVMVVDLKRAQGLAAEDWLVVTVQRHSRMFDGNPAMEPGELTGIAVVKVIAENPDSFAVRNGTGNGYYAPGRVFSYMNEDLLTLEEAREKYGDLPALKQQESAGE